ncbi:hypothetical protein ABZY93_25665 [Streptomyces smyrnaeus]|uniref:hypothetical protein n=1 Tax=Streptomyces smyrnaeus TaxID=1387713 RepID=UPI0033B074BC
MTDLYGVRVLAVDPPRRRIRLRVTVVYYDIGSHAPLTDDASFFLRIFGETAHGAPLGEVITQDQRLDEAWVDANTRWFIESVERIATRNHPFTQEVEEWLDENRVSFPWEEEPRFGEMTLESAAALLRSEETSVGADYEVVVTDSRWIAHLTVGDWWRTASYSTCADRPLAGEAAMIPDLRHPAAELEPFSHEDAPRHLEFSDDGGFLAVTSDAGELVVYETTHWRECLRAGCGDYISPWLMWVPGEPVVTLRHHEGLLPQLAYDAVSGTPVEAPPQSGRLRSATGQYRTEGVCGPAITLLLPTGEERIVPVGEDEADDEAKLADLGSYEAAAFSADESRVFLARGTRVYVMAPADGRILEVIENDEIEIRFLTVSPGGDYLAISGESPGMLEVIIRRVSDHQVVTRHAIGRGWYPLQTYEMAWSPDGRWLAANLTSVNRDWESEGGRTHIFRVGLPTEPAAPVSG